MTTQCKRTEAITKQNPLLNGRKARQYPRGTNAGERNSFAKLEDSDIPLIMELIRSGMALKAIAEKFDVSAPTINKIKNGKTWTHITGGCVYNKTKYVWKDDVELKLKRQGFSW